MCRMKKNGPQKYFLIKFWALNCISNKFFRLQVSTVRLPFHLVLQVQHISFDTDRIKAIFDGIMACTGVIQVFKYHLTVLKEVLTFNLVIFRLWQDKLDEKLNFGYHHHIWFVNQSPYLFSERTQLLDAFICHLLHVLASFGHHHQVACTTDMEKQSEVEASPLQLIHQNTQWLSGEASPLCFQ
jgi:hypothetical protein